MSSGDVLPFVETDVAHRLALLDRFAPIAEANMADFRLLYDAAAYAQDTAIETVFEAVRSEAEPWALSSLGGGEDYDYEPGWKQYANRGTDVSIWRISVLGDQEAARPAATKITMGLTLPANVRGGDMAVMQRPLVAEVGGRNRQFIARRLEVTHFPLHRIDGLAQNADNVMQYADGTYLIDPKGAMKLECPAFPSFETLTLEARKEAREAALPEIWEQCEAGFAEACLADVAAGPPAPLERIARDTAIKLPDDLTTELAARDLLRKLAVAREDEDLAVKRPAGVLREVLANPEAKAAVAFMLEHADVLDSYTARRIQHRLGWLRDHYRAVEGSMHNMEQVLLPGYALPRLQALHEQALVTREFVSNLHSRTAPLNNPNADGDVWRFSNGRRPRL